MEAENQYNAHLFAQAMTTPVMMAHYARLSTPPPTTIDPSTTIKMEDFASSMPSYASTPLPPTSNPAMSIRAGSTPPPTSAEGKSVKKRKSWGQVLPEPKTNLPPRKRAKTEDEKEQRRIERVKRNRLAAHNSRERKRQEVELLQQEKDKLEQDLKAAHAAMARMAAQLKAIQSRHPNEAVDHTFDTSSSLVDDGYESLVGQSDTVCPRQTSFPSPVSMDSMDSPRDDSCQPETPAYTESVVTDLDQTRYPAAILCDLQCQSSSALRSLQVQATLAYLILFNLTLPSMKSLLTIFSTSSRSLTTAWNSQAAWWTTPISSAPASSTPTPQTLMAFLTDLMQSTTSTCRQPLAQRSPLATRLSQPQSASIESIGRPSGTRGRAEIEGVKRKRRYSDRFRKGRRPGKDILTSKPHLKRWLESLEAVQNLDDGH